MSTQTLLWIDDHTPLPPTRRALGPDSEAPGLLAAGGRVTPARLEEAYRHGVFPWYSPGQPVLWWSPDPRMVLHVADFRLSHSLRKTLRRFVRDPACEIRIDSAFAAVMQACASVPREGQHGTWIVPELLQAYGAWHALGRVHSVETWIGGELVGGLYGVGIGRMFYGESMFAFRTDASKIALAALVAFCRAHGIGLIDCQQHTRHLASFGAQEIPRPAFEAHLAYALAAPAPPTWAYHSGLWAQLGIGAPASDRSPSQTA
ncbi:leucyl/phenylalanyl-tRNA--protein transferase [Aquincola sp. S2]|uniref:Leucyl/phenylalanyl-tRNA--protein transferase n=1 Tax=Pseudaquabacterium terrae TaxID=2732868 RepID=A0ABX2EPU9_9BURK|nr:leucyl/phenylalanyl-tRNA--protein transferase [Aquabacterium terrae]NRF70643.1 leucyl/phenylalanyl-tRNA--protein transferase [Aquabacterium terrae]